MFINVFDTDFVQSVNNPYECRQSLSQNIKQKVGLWFPKYKFLYFVE